MICLVHYVYTKAADLSDINLHYIYIFTKYGLHILRGTIFLYEALVGGKMGKHSRKKGREMAIKIINYTLRYNKTFHVLPC